MMTVRGFFSGSFDPLTNGHVDVIRQALGIVSHLVVGIGTHPSKKPMFDFNERKAMIEQSVVAINADWGVRVSVVAFSGLVVDAALEQEASVIIRGLRDGSDLDYEMQMAGMNGEMRPQIQTLFLPASPEMRHITATLVRQIALMDGNVTPFVPEFVAKAINNKIK